MTFKTLCVGFVLAISFASQPPTRACGAEEPFAFRSGGEVVVRVEQLDSLRLKHKKLAATVRLTGSGGEKTFAIDLADPVVPDSLVFDVTSFGDCTAVTLKIVDGAGVALLERSVSPVPNVKTPDTAPLAAGHSSEGAFAAIEPGSKIEAIDGAPKIALLDSAMLRHVQLSAAARTVTSEEITYPVIADVDLPGSGSSNYVIVSRQSFAPNDPTKCSLYFSYRKPLFDGASMQLKEWRKMLVEVPLDETWLQKQGDEVITLPFDRFAIHTTEERERFGKRWNDPKGYNMLGGSSTGLYQGGQTADVDEQGRIYITNVADGAAIVRFNPHTGTFEQPPVNFAAEARKFLPTGDGWNRSFDHDLPQVVCTRGRVYLVFDRNTRSVTPNGNYETCSGVVSLPQENWHDSEAFRRDVRLHAGCWPTAQFPLYADEPKPATLRRAGLPIATDRGIAFGTYRLDLDADGNSERLAVIKNIADTVDAAGKPLPPTKQLAEKGLPRQRFFNVGGAGRAFVRQAYGEFGISRAALALTLPAATAEQVADNQGRHRSTFSGAPPGELTIRFDLMTKIKSDPSRYGMIAASMSGVSQGPSYALIPIPGEPDQAIGVCEYNYFYSKIDFSRRSTERKVFKSYLTQSSNGRKTGFPVAVGLGPYNATWIEHDDATWLYMMGYTGMSRLKYAEQGRPLEGFAVDVFHNRLKPDPIDGVGRDNVKDFLHLIPATDGRWIDIGRGRVGRGGGARSAGLEIFDPRTLGKSRTAVEMNRCFGLYTPVCRLVFSTTDAPPRQELFVASGGIRPEYVADIVDPAERPKNQDPKVFLYDCDAAGELRDLYGFSLPTLGGREGSANLAMSPCRRFLVLMQAGGAISTYHIGERRFVDGLQLRTPDGLPVAPLEFSAPSANIWTSPNGRIFFHTVLEGAAAKQVHFFEVSVARDGSLTVSPHLTVATGKEAAGRDFERIIRCFLPDLTKQDGSFDLVLGSDKDNGGQSMVRVIEDFIPPQIGKQRE